MACRSASRMCSTKWGSSNSPPPSRMCSGSEGSRAAIRGSISARRGSDALTATRSTRSSVITSIMQRSASSGTQSWVIRSSVEDDRRRAVRDLADLVEQAEAAACLAALGDQPSRVAGVDRGPDQQRHPDQVVGGAEVVIPAAAGRREADDQDRNHDCRLPATAKSGQEGSRRKCADQHHRGSGANVDHHQGDDQRHRRNQPRPVVHPAGKVDASAGAFRLYPHPSPHCPHLGGNGGSRS